MKTISSELFSSTWLLPTKSTVKQQRSFEKTEDLKRGVSEKLLKTWETEYTEVSQLNISSYTVQKWCSLFVFHICHN